MSPSPPISPVAFATTPPRTVLPRSQPPRHQSTPAVPNARQQSVPMAATASLPPTVPLQSSQNHVVHHTPTSTSASASASTSTSASSSSSYRPTAFTPATSYNAFSGPSRPRSPPPPPVPASGRPSASSGSGSNSAGPFIPVVPVAAAQIPQTGASKMAAAAKRGVTGVDGVARSRRGSQLTAYEEGEEHPLSEKNLKARLVHACPLFHPAGLTLHLLL